MSRSFSRSTRYVQIEQLLLASRMPLSQAEIARRCEVSRATISRMVQSMHEFEIPLRIDDQGRLYVERTAYISTLKLRLHEAVSLFLSGRLLARYSNHSNSHTVEALEKLAASLSGVMPVLGNHIATTSARLRANLPKQSSDYQRVLEKVTEAWARGTKVQIWYRPPNAQRAYQHTFAPYLIEPSGIGYSTYVIGMAEPPGKIRTRKLDRIERILSTDEPFDVPADFDPNVLLAGAWSIWFDEGDKPVTVTLRFSPTVRKRVEESRWHPSERIEPDGDGGLMWTADIDEPQEMKPWIRGWGAGVTVVSPPELREEMIGEVRQQMRLYGIADTDVADRQQRFDDIFG